MVRRRLGRYRAVGRLSSYVLVPLVGIPFMGPSQGRHRQYQAAMRCLISVR